MAIKNNKNIFLIAIIMLGVLLVPAFASAAQSVTLLTPAQDAAIKGTTYNLTMSITEPSEVCNVTFYYKTSTGTTWTFIGSAANTTANQTGWSRVLDTSGITDAKDYVFNVSVSTQKSTNSFTLSDSSTGVDVDNTAPTAIIQSNKPKVTFLDPIGFDYDCSTSSDNQDTSLTYSVVWTKADGDTITETSSTGTFSDSDLNSVGTTGYLVCTVTDDAGNTDASDAVYVSVGNGKTSTTTGEEEAAVAAKEKKTTNMIIISISAVVVLIIVIVAVIKSGSKRRKKR